MTSPLPPSGPAGSVEASEPRFVTVSRRAFLGRAAAVGAVAAIPGLACGRDDSGAFADAEPVDLSGQAGGSTSTPAATSSPGAASNAVETTTVAPAATETSTTPTTIPPTTETETTDVTTTTEVAADAPIAGELLVSFTYASDGSGRGNRRPYVAVWIEDAAGELVDTISLWFLQAREGPRWLDDLSRWYAASAGGGDTTMSSATREAGSYTVAWDGTALNGSSVAAGEYVVFIEAAREDGPYSLTSSPITLGAAPASVSLADDTELLGAQADWTV